MKKRWRLSALVAALALMMSGCGTPLYEITDDEENLIVQYSAQILAKYNIDQKDGMTTAQPETETEEETQAPETEEPETEQTEGSSGTATGTQSETQQAAEEVSVAEALGHGSELQVTCKSRKLQDIYREGNYFAINPDDGKQLAVFTFSIKNTGDQTIDLDTVSVDNPFYMTADGVELTEETVSLGVQSLSYYSGKIKPGKTKKAVLLFQIPDSYTGDLSEAQLSVELDGTIYPVKL